MSTRQECANQIYAVKYWRSPDGQIYKWDTINATYTLMRRVADHGGRDVRAAHEEIVEWRSPLPDVDDDLPNDLMGFACVDCNETDVFDKEETFAVMSTVADALYWPIRRLKEVQNQERDTENS